MSNFMVNEVPNIYDDDENDTHTHPSGTSIVKRPSQVGEPQKSAPDQAGSTNANQNSQSENRMLEYNSPHPATANSMQNIRAENAMAANNTEDSYTSFEKRYPEKPETFAAQNYSWSQSAAHPAMNEQYSQGSNNRGSYSQVSPSTSLGSSRSVSLVNASSRPAHSPIRAASGSGASHSTQPPQANNAPTLPNHHRKPSLNKSTPQNHPAHISSHEPDGRRWTSRIETPQDLEVPAPFPYPPYGYHHLQHQGMGMRGSSAGSRPSYDQNFTPPSRTGMPPGPGQQDRDIEGLGIHTYSASPRRSQMDGAARRASAHEIGYPEGHPGWAENNPQRAPQYYPGYAPGGIPGYPLNPWTGQGYPHPLIPGQQVAGRGNQVPEWPNQNQGYMGAPGRVDTSSSERPPGGWYWSVTTVHQHKRTESRSTQQRHRHDTGREENTVPVQLCEPPLANIVPPNPAALAGDPPPKNKKKSKYTVEQDKLILDLKHQGLGWSEIAKLAKCDKTLAARNRYQVLIGQQGGGTFLWSHSEIRKLQSYLDEAERAKWLYLADELSRRRGRKFTLAMCHYKISEMFRENPAIFGVLKSKDPRSGGKPVKREEYVPHFSAIPPDDSPSYSY